MGKIGAPATSKATIKKNTIEDMKKLGVYYPESDLIIDIYAGMCEQYYDAMREFVDSGCKYSTVTGAGGEKKSAILSTIEVLRKDILAYADRLCIVPKAIIDCKKTIELKKPSKLEELLMNV